MTQIDLSALSPRHRAHAKRAIESARKRVNPIDAAVRPRVYDSTIEAEFARDIDVMAKTGAQFDGWNVVGWDYHPMAFNLASGLTYTPDFAMEIEHAATRYCLVEVKGSWKAKNARDSRTRLLIAAHRFPMFCWVAVTQGISKRWQIEWIRK